MTKDEFEQESSQHLNAASIKNRKQILESFDYKTAIIQKDWEGAIQIVLSQLYGQAKTPRQGRRMREKQHKTEEIKKRIDELLL